jgi:hypothetical protein
MMNNSVQKICKTASCLGLAVTLGLSGCQSLSQSPDGSEQSSTEPEVSELRTCPEGPTRSLSNTETLNLQDQNLQRRLEFSEGEDIGFTFTGTAGHELDSRYPDNEVCVWIYTPDNRILSSSTLPRTGQYTIQVASRYGSKVSILELELFDPESRVVSTEFSGNPERGDTRSSGSTPTSNRRRSASSSPSISFDRSSFPKAECGDSLPTNSSSYPVNFYPVNAPYTEQNLQRAKSLFCRDSYKKYISDSDEYKVQIASFTNRERAEAFSELVGTEIRGTHIGEVSTMERP